MIDPFSVALNTFGVLSILVSITILLLFAFSWKNSRLIEVRTVCGVSVALYLFATAYGFLCFVYVLFLLRGPYG